MNYEQYLKISNKLVSLISTDKIDETAASWYSTKKQN